MGALTGNPSPLGPRLDTGLRSTAWTTAMTFAGRCVFSHHPPRPHHTGPGRTSDHREPTSPGTAAQRGRDPGRSQRRVLRPPRAGPDRRRIIRRPRSARPSAAARRHRTRPPPRPRPHRRWHPDLGPCQAPHPGQGRLPAEPAVGVGGHHRRRRVRPGPAPEPPRHQHPRPSVLLARPRRWWSHAEPGQVPVPRSCLARLLPGLGPVRRDVRRRHASRGRTRPARPGSPRPRRRALDTQRDVQATLGRPRCPHPRHRHAPGERRSRAKRFRHPVVGELTLAYEELAVTAEPGLVLLVYTAEPGSPSAERLGLLASWAASAETATPTSITQNDDH